MYPGRIAFIGAGHIAHCLVQGLMNHGVDASCIGVSNPTPGKLQDLARDWPGLKTSASNPAIAEGRDIVVICVRPNVVRTVCEEISDIAALPSCVLVSVASGVTLESLDAWTQNRAAIVRCMPNAPVAVGRGLAPMCANARVTPQQKQAVQTLFNAVAKTTWLADEAQMHLVTALAGSGPAYFFRIVEAFSKAAAELGLPSDTAAMLAVETFCGAAALAEGEADDMADLCRKIAVKGGTTECGLGALERAGLNAIAKDVLDAAAARSLEISEQMSRR